VLASIVEGILIPVEEELVVPHHAVLVSIQIRTGHLVGMRARTPAWKDDNIAEVVQTRDIDGFEHSNISRHNRRVLRDQHWA